MSRLGIHLTAGAIHLGASAIVAMLALGLIFGLWYPGALAQAQGVNHLVILMIGVDVMIGPLITTIIYDPRKKWLRLDLMIIAALQTVALLYALKAIYGGRPAYIVFNVDRFDVVAVQDVNRPSLARVNPEFGISFWGPKTVGARLPDDDEKRTGIMMSAVSGGADLPQLPEYFLPIEEEKKNLIARSHPLEELRGLNELTDAAWSKLLSDFDRPGRQVAYLPVRAKAKDIVMLLDTATGALLGARVLTPQFENRGHGSSLGDSAKPARPMGVRP